MPQRIRTLYAALTLLLLVSACGKPGGRNGQDVLDGVWTLQREEFPGVYISDYPRGGVANCKIFTSDSLYFECRLRYTSTGIVLLPYRKGIYELIPKGNNEYLYFEDHRPRPLQILNDTTIRIQISGREYTWVRNSSMTESRQQEIRNIVERDSVEVNEDQEVMSYVLSTSERELKATNYRLLFLAAALALVLLLVSAYLIQVNKRKKLVERQLQQIREERETRPQPVARAFEEVEQDFLQSDFFLQLHRRVGEGAHVGDLDWTEMERQLLPIYPSFVNRLPTLCHMSDTENCVCLLIKYRFSPSEMAQVLCKDISTISSIRSRLYKKVFDQKGKAKDWDDFILSL